MRIRLTNIALHHDGRTFDEGAVVEGVILGEGEVFADDEIPYELAEARVASGSAEPVIDGVTTVSAAATAAGALMASAVLATRTALSAVLDAAEGGTASDKLALAQALDAYAVVDEPLAARAKAFRQEVGELRDELAKAAAEKPKRARAKAGDA
jgi:hypothetical protein